MDYYEVNMKIIMLQLNNMRNQEELPWQNFLDLIALLKLNTLYMLIIISRDSFNTANNEKITQTQNTNTPLFSKDT
jgi:hypothetical protein